MRGSVMRKILRKQRARVSAVLPSLFGYMKSRRNLTVWLAAMIVAVLALNWIYQVFRKPAELLFPVSGTLSKTPAQTWAQYGPLFRRYSTAIISAELLAALAQVEGAGDPLARPGWRWRASADPREVYRPASSALGMYQITDATFVEARRYCIRDHAVLEDACWFNGLYTRVIPSHAVELTAAFLDRRVAALLARHRVAGSAEQKQNLAALIHLCGASAGEAYVRRGFRLADNQRCGEHDARAYLARVNAMKRLFARLAALA
jgi:hypothetical protein